MVWCSPDSNIRHASWPQDYVGTAQVTECDEDKDPYTPRVTNMGQQGAHSSCDTMWRTWRNSTSLHLILFLALFWHRRIRVWCLGTKNNRPGGYSDLNLQSNVYFVLAGSCELQLHICKEFDQIPFSKCLKPGFWAISFWYMHALLINVFFSGAFSSEGFFVQLSISSLKQVFLLGPLPLPLLRICPNSSHMPWRNM